MGENQKNAAFYILHPTPYTPAMSDSEEAVGVGGVDVGWGENEKTQPSTPSTPSTSYTPAPGAEPSQQPANPSDSNGHSSKAADVQPGAGKLCEGEDCRTPMTLDLDGTWACPSCGI